MASARCEPALEASYPAQPSQVPAIRRAVADVARRRGVRDAKLVQITLAVSEAASNAILHAYRDALDPAAAGDVHVVVRAVDESLLDICIRDRGVGPGPRHDSPGLGLGLGLMARETEHFEIRAVPEGGTEVTMRFAI